MNTKIKLFVILLTLMSIGVSSCNDDEKAKTDYAKEIAGTYKGNITLAGDPVATDVQIDVVYKSENKVSLKMNQTIPVINLPINIESPSDVTYTNNVYNISTSASIEIGMPIPIPVTVAGTIDKTGTATFNIGVAIPDAPVNAVYTGTKQ
jgi:hypothetical protein